MQSVEKSRLGSTEGKRRDKLYLVEAECSWAPTSQRRVESFFEAPEASGSDLAFRRPARLRSGSTVRYLLDTPPRSPGPGQIEKGRSVSPSIA